MATQAEVKTDELEAAIAELDKDDRIAVVETLRECADETDYDEPSVGIYANPRMSHLFRTVACLVEQLPS